MFELRGHPVFRREHIAPDAASNGVGAFWNEPAATWLQRLNTRESGLGSDEARTRLARYGRNEPAAAPRRRLLGRILRRLTNPLVVLLIVASAIAGATGEWTTLVMVLAILAMSLALEVFQEHRAETAVDALRAQVALSAKVRRDGAAVEVPVAELVPGDVVELGGGDLVPADAVLMEARNVLADEAVLTGESLPVEKRPGAAQGTSPADADGALFGGTALVSGTAVALVVATGAHTRFGGIAAALRSEQPPTAFERGLTAFGRLLLKLMVALVTVVLAAHLLFGRPALEALMFALALAIGLTPEMLPMITTVTLSRGAVRMAARKVIVKRLAAIHDLGAMDVLCTDKTGTLTEGRVDLTAHVDADGRDAPRVLELAAASSALASGMTNALDTAVLAKATAQGWRRVADLPFDFRRRLVSVLAESDGRRLLVAKGAPEAVLERCSQVDTGAGQVAITDADRARIAGLVEAAAQRGERCLAVACRDMPATQETVGEADETDLTFCGLCTFSDLPKADAADAVARLLGLGVQVKMISGDAPGVATHVAQRLGWPRQDLLTGADIDRLSDAALTVRVDACDLFARVDPDQKTRIIRALRARKRVVGFLGDGINDAPAIHAADVGLSVDGATDVARAAADLILLKHDLMVVADGVEEGRRTYANIMKYVRMWASSNFGNMVSMAAASLAIPFLPLTPIQLLLNDLLYDASETGLPFDRVSRAETAAPHAWEMRPVVRFMVTMGLISSVFDIATFYGLLAWFHAPPEVFRTAWFLESLATQVLVVFLLREPVAGARVAPHPLLVASSLGALAMGVAIATSPAGRLIGFAPLDWTQALFVVALVAAYLASTWALRPLAVRPSKPAAERRS